MTKLIGEVYWDESIQKYVGTLTVTQGDRTVGVFTCRAKRADQAQSQVSGYADELVGRYNRVMVPSVWTKEWEVVN